MNEQLAHKYIRAAMEYFRFGTVEAGDMETMVVFLNNEGFKLSKLLPSEQEKMQQECYQILLKKKETQFRASRLNAINKLFERCKNITVDGKLYRTSSPKLYRTMSFMYKDTEQSLDIIDVIERLASYANHVEGCRLTEYEGEPDIESFEIDIEYVVERIEKQEYYIGKSEYCS